MMPNTEQHVIAYVFQFAIYSYSFNLRLLIFFFFFNDPATPEIYPLPLHDALPILPGRSETEAFDEAIEQVDAAESWGLDAMWLAEIHFAPERTYLSSPLAIASAIAARTQIGRAHV